MPAVTHLTNAFRLDPGLREIARVDGDVTDLLNDIDTPGDNNSDGAE